MMSKEKAHRQLGTSAHSPVTTYSGAFLHPAQVRSGKKYQCPAFVSTLHSYLALRIPSISSPQTTFALLQPQELGCYPTILLVVWLGISSVLLNMLMLHSTCRACACGDRLKPLFTLALVAQMRVEERRDVDPLSELRFTAITNLIERREQCWGNIKNLAFR
ncbi:hypothetical protein HDK64DRAFT_13791 [Phyllosticta capitalensis]